MTEIREVIVRADTKFFGSGRCFIPAKKNKKVRQYYKKKR